MSQKTIARKRSASTKKARAKPAPRRSRRASATTPLIVESPVPRATSSFDDDEVLVSGGSVVGLGFGRCGGRILSSKIEQQLCMMLSRNGVTHSHSPRHFEVRYKEPTEELSKAEVAKNIAAYAPMIVLRGRGREGKTVVIEAATEVDEQVLLKIKAFRRQYGVEFYLIFVGTEEVLEEVPFEVYDESCTTNDVGTLINRLSD